MSKLQVLISNDEPIKKFEKYISDNERVMLSARFGDGKTTFLNEFKEKANNKYNYITLYPVNYQVADNNDIFEYIKRDILIQLLCVEDILKDTEQIEQSLRLFCYFNSNKNTIIKDLLVAGSNFIPIEGVAISKAIKILSEHIDKFNTQYQESGKSEEDIITDYITSFKNGIYEFDPISQLISDLTSRYKQTTDKPTVLIVEDLDRVDPRHLFRIMNIFSAHIDRQFKVLKELELFSHNKFGFDKIVFVCHIENIEHIFKHFYGELADFSGYITKFTTAKPFSYSLRDEYEAYISTLIQNLVPTLNRVLLAWLVKQIISNDSGQMRLAVDNLRSIDQKLKNYTPSFIDTYLYRSDNRDLAILSDNPFTRFLDICIKFNIDVNEIHQEPNTAIPLYDLIGVNWSLDSLNSISISELKFAISENSGSRYTLEVKCSCHEGINIIEEVTGSIGGILGEINLKNRAISLVDQLHRQCNIK